MVKVLVIGPPRSGTSTLHTAFKRAGLNSAHGSVEGADAPLALQLWRAFLEDRDPFHYIPEGVDVLSDVHITRPPKWDKRTVWPTHTMLFLQCVQACHPQTLILLNTRNPEAWEQSVTRWKDLKRRIVKSDLPYLPSGKGGETSELAYWICRYYQRVRNEHFTNFLEVAIESSATPRMIEGRLGIKLPWWGVRNANPER